MAGNEDSNRSMTLETPGLGPALSATIVTPDLDASLDAWTGHLHQHIHERGRIGPEQARRWGCDDLTGARQAWLANTIGEAWLRLIEVRNAEVVDPFCHRGWLSLEISVQDVDALGRELESSPFEIIGTPKNLDVSDDIRAMQVLGPAGEVLYLTEVKAAVPPFELPFARCPVDRLFIPVMLVDDRESALEFYQRFPRLAALKFETKITVINRARRLDVERQHPVATIQLKGKNLIEIDQLDGLRDRPVSAAGLPGGIALITFAVESIPDGLCSGDGVSVYHGNGGELIELIEIT